MTDPYIDCESALVDQLRTLNDPYFPESEGRPAGWQVSDNDMVPLSGGDYFITYRPAAFTKPQQKSQFNDNEWHILINLHMRFSEYDSVWSAFKVFRGAVLALPETAPLKTVGIYFQDFAAQGQAGFLVDAVTNQNYNIVVQSIDVTIRQRVRVTRGF